MAIFRVRAAQASLAPANEITRAADLLDLSRAEASKEYPVRLRGVVTCFDREAVLCFVYDGAASVYVYLTTPLDLSAGDVVSVAGFTGTGLFAPIVQRASITRIARTNLPPAKPVTLDQLATGREDSQFVQVEGVVHAEFASNNNRHLKIGYGSTALKVCLLRYGSGGKPLINTKLRIQGVAVARQRDRDRQTAVELFVSSPEHVQIIEFGNSEPFEAPVILGRSLQDYSHKGRSEHWLHLRGVVTYPIRDQAFYIRDEGGAIRVETDKAGPHLRVGDTADCVGFVSLDSYSPVITDAEFRTTTNHVEVFAVPVTFAQAASGRFDNELVQLKATVIEAESISPNESSILLESDQHTFPMHIPVSKESLRLGNGTQVSATGICSMAPPGPHRGEPFRLLARGKNDCEILKLPPWWRNQRVPWVVGLSIAGCLALWTVSLRGRVRRQVDALQENEKRVEVSVRKAVAREIESRTQVEGELRLSEQRLQAAIEERERLARDLHDGMIQTIYAIGLNIEECSCSAPANATELRRHLGKIKGDLNRVIEEVRNFILGIESPTVTGSEFKTALKSMVLTIAESHRGKVRLEVDRHVAEELSPEQATQLLHIAREAMANSFRHSEADRVVFSLLQHSAHLRFEIRDNGKGFDVNLPAGRGLGLRNMAARAAEMGAAYSMVSEIGSGTRITLDLPPRKGISSTHEYSRPDSR